MEILLLDQDKRIIFTTNQVSVQTGSGRTIDSRDDPRGSYAGQTADSAWDDIHVGYFDGYALWQYLTAPFLYTYPGFEVAEAESWQEDGETWRVLKVVFPDYLAAHTRVQHAYYGPDGLLRRHQYTVDVLGGAQGVNYASKYEEVDGIMIPMKRRVFAYGPDGRKIPEPLLISIDISNLRLF